MDKNKKKIKESLEELEEAQDVFNRKISRIKAKQKEILERIVKKKDKNNLKKIEKKLKSV